MLYYKTFIEAIYEKQRDTRSKPCEILAIGEQGDKVKYNGVTIIRNKKCNTWYVRKRINGEQIYISGKSQNECIKKLKELLGVEKKTKTKEKTLQNWFEEWLKIFKIGKVKEATIKDYHKTIKNLSDEIMSKPIKSILPLDIINELDKIIHNRTKQKVYELLLAIFDKALNLEIIKKNIIKQIDKPKHIREKGIALDIEEQQRFIKYCKNNQYGKLYLVILYQGLRIGEALALTFSDIDLNQKTININKSYNEQGKFDTTKNQQSNRIMPIFQPTLQIFNEITINSGRIFNIAYTTARENLKEILKQADLQDISLHDLRHTFVTNCQNEKIPEHIIQSWIGHQIGSRVTSSVYTHTTNDANLLNINKLNNSKFYSDSTQILLTNKKR